MLFDPRGSWTRRRVCMKPARARMITGMLRLKTAYVVRLVTWFGGLRMLLAGAHPCAYKTDPTLRGLSICSG